jgi:twinkle protein
MATVCKVDFIVLDHISIVTSGIESSSEGERKDIDILMTRLRSLIEETGIGIVAIVHLKRVNGKNFNEGAQVSLSDLRGSGSLEQLSDNVIALERNQQVDR